MLITDLLVWSKSCLIILKPSELSNHDLTSAALQADGSCTTGPRVIPSARTHALAPPDSCRDRCEQGEEGETPSTAVIHKTLNTLHTL